MDLQFEIGDPQRPRGHAILYFRVATEPDNVYGTYIITLPITADLTKYVPPFLAAHLGSAGSGPLANFSAFAMPPMSELVEGGYEQLVRLANVRNDDLVYGGSMFSYDLARMMESVAQAVQEYADLLVPHRRRGERLHPAPPRMPPFPLGGVLSPRRGGGWRRERQPRRKRGALELHERGATRLAEMGRLLGRLRFAQEGNDSAAIADVIAEMTALGRHLPDEFGIGSLVDAAHDTTPNGVQLAQLYLDRCYRLFVRRHRAGAPHR